MKKLLALLLLFGIVGCEKEPSTLTIVCEGTSYFDEAYTFNFDTGDIHMSKSLNAYGSEQKRLVYERLDSNLESGYITEEAYGTFDKLFSEEDSNMVIRNTTDGFITFGYTKEANDVYDIEHTLNRASLQKKIVTKMDKSVIPEGYDVKPETTTFMDCKKPNV